MLAEILCTAVHLPACLQPVPSKVHALCREWHRKRLAKRLLAANNVDTMEEAFLTKLKSRCGAQFTQKMEGMCIDLKTAQQKQTEFHAWQEKPDNVRACALLWLAVGWLCQDWDLAVLVLWCCLCA